ncbi:MAG: L,D-transpeptidase family protein [Saprospiraceae bacterium]|nr:L,D-transpeptidase family protein [Saprospiraceae bacterium]MCF8250145.1 L,D-transpeptidase family protein [Saprospiraceae bacterium]MCF8279409.1 L,D-transpeptidase family protein [Bacteroidales bacterium]MCF8311199.1 L,D-transpeptidase family protein [Saprospiraceae bacterium]MCF8440420.1 L,D-transpeptidase family protein [Saprospiraceae bacterium]
MKKLLLLLLLCSAIACNNHTLPQSEKATSCRQLVVVRSPTDTSTQANLQRFEKNGKKWKRVGKRVDVTLGRSGLAWGKGEHAYQPGQQKREGDGKSPSGVYTFGEIFGYAPASEASFRMPYVQADEALECVDDSGSKFYNQLVDNKLVQIDWTSSEFMHRPDHQYKWGIMVNHNTPSLAQGGSCIFLHIWYEPGAATSGCTAMTEANLLTLLHWLDPAKSPLLLQVTEAEYPVFRKDFGLPE